MWSLRVWPSAPVLSRLSSLCEASLLLLLLLLLLVLPEALVGSVEVNFAFLALWLADRDVVRS